MARIPVFSIAAFVFPADRAMMPSKAGRDGTRLQIMDTGPLAPVRVHRTGTAINRSMTTLMQATQD